MQQQDFSNTHSPSTLAVSSTISLLPVRNRQGTRWMERPSMLCDRCTQRVVVVAATVVEVVDFFFSISLLTN